VVVYIFGVPIEGSDFVRVSFFLSAALHASMKTLSGTLHF